MHIIWVNDHADFTGGCERYIADMVMTLKRFGVKSSLLYSVGSPHSSKFTQLFDQSFPMVDLALQLPKLNADLLYVHSVEDISNIKLLTESSIPSVRFFHDQKPFCLREHKYTAIGHKTCNKAVGSGCYSCLGFVKPGHGIAPLRFKSVRQQKSEIAVNYGFDHFIVGSHYMKNELKKNGFDQLKITVATLFSNDLEPNNNDSDIQVLSTPSMIKENQLLFVGQLVRGKGLDTLLQALSISQSNYELLICGSGKMEIDYKEQALKLGISSRVQFLGHLGKEELQKHYKESAAVVIPARAPETFCLVGLEALINGTPVIASNVGGMSEWFKPGFNGLACEANNANFLAKQLDTFKQNGSLRNELRLNIATDSYTRFEAAHHTLTLRNVFEKIIKVAS